MVNDVTSSTASTATTSAADAAMKKSTGLNKDDFLKLFVKQLQNQDPLNPQDSSQFVAQLAQLTQVEQAYNTNTNLSNLTQAFNSSNSISAVNLMGKGITATGNSIGVVQQGASQKLQFDLPVAANNVVVQISNASGSVVKTIVAGNLPSGRSSVNWDGTSGSGAQLPAGTYTFAVSGKSGDGSSDVSGTTYVSGTVGGVVMNGTTPTVTVNGINVPLSQIVSVGS